MQSELFQNFINSISSLTSDRRDVLNIALISIHIDSSEPAEITASPLDFSESFLKTKLSSSDLEISIVTYFSENPQCPKCSSQRIGLRGSQSGRKRYHCNTCSKIFNAFSGTPLARLRYPNANVLAE